MKRHKIKPVPALTDFTNEEVKLLKHWYSSGIVKKYLTRNQNSQKRFSFFDGPITANNPMGVHHGWGRTYKDLWQRYHNMRGYKLRFQNGFDCQGLWVEVEVEKDLGFKSKKDIEAYGVAKFVQKCKDRVLKFSAIQTEQSKRLGYFMDWDNSYFTMSDDNNYMIWHFLKVCHERGWLYKGNDSVPWCPRCETAISQHEMLTEDYREVFHQAVYLSLPLVNRLGEYLLVWTTTPWTIPANIAVAVDKKLAYALVNHQGKKYWLAKQTVSRVFSDQSHKIISTLAGTKLVGLKYQAPYDHLDAVNQVAHTHPKTFHTVVPTDATILPISQTEGTGLVHTAVSAGAEDFRLGQKLGLPMIPVIADNADYLPGLGELSGQNAKTHPRLILDYLEQNNWAFKIANYSHRYPACWRCKTELVWKVTDEWYIAMDTGKPSLRQRMKAVAKKIRWIPDFGLERELDWLNNMHDWLISKKNRYWGLCLPIWECPHCGHFEVIGSKDELKQKAVSGWDQFAGKSPHKPQIDQVKIACPQCAKTISRIEPVGNPWLDAGIIPFSTLVDPQTQKLSYTYTKRYFGQWFPAHFITESFPGQFKNWFYSLIAMSTVLENTHPFQTVLGYASLLAEDGRPMHKSWGNAIEFNEGAQKIGVDVMRWVYCRQNPAQNLLFGFKTASEVKRQFHLLLWNSYRFFANYAALENWQPPKIPAPKLPILDRWLLARLHLLVTTVTSSLNDFDTYHATLSLEQFVTDLSTWYIRLSRDRIGPSAPQGLDKENCFSTLHTTLHVLSRLLAPFIPFLSDLIYTNLASGAQSVHLADWPVISPPVTKNVTTELFAPMTLVRDIVEKGHAQRKLHQIPLRQPLAKLTVFGVSQPLAKDFTELLMQELNIKQVEWDTHGKSFGVSLDTTITPALRSEGQSRQLIRQIQQARKQAGTRLDEWVNATVPELPSEFASEIMRQTLVKKFIPGDKLHIHRL